MWRLSNIPKIVVFSIFGRLRSNEGNEELPILNRAVEMLALISLYTNSQLQPLGSGLPGRIASPGWRSMTPVLSQPLLEKEALAHYTTLARQMDRYKVISSFNSLFSEVVLLSLLPKSSLITPMGCIGVEILRYLNLLLHDTQLHNVVG